MGREIKELSEKMLEAFTMVSFANFYCRIALPRFLQKKSRLNQFQAALLLIQFTRLIE